MKIDHAQLGQPCILVLGLFKMIRTQIIKHPIYVSKDTANRMKFKDGEGYYIKVAYHPELVHIKRLIKW